MREAETKGTEVKNYFREISCLTSHCTWILEFQTSSTPRHQTQLLHLAPVERDCATYKKYLERNRNCQLSTLYNHMHRSPEVVMGLDGFKKDLMKENHNMQFSSKWSNVFCFIFLNCLWWCPPPAWRTEDVHETPLLKWGFVLDMLHSVKARANMLEVEHAEKM